MENFGNTISTNLNVLTHRRSKNNKNSGDNQVVTRRAVRQMLQSNATTRLETKYFIAFYGNVINNAGSITDMTAIPQGDSDLTRDGDALNLIRSEVILSVDFAESNALRTVIFLWKPFSVPTVSSVLQNIGAYGFASPLTHDTRNQYTILYDNIIYGVGTTSSGRQGTSFRLNLPRIQTRFDAGTTSGSNKVYVVQITDSAAAPHPAVVISIKHWFTDA